MEIRVRHFFALLCSVGMVSAMAACAPEETGAITEDGTENAAVATDTPQEPGVKPETNPYGECCHWTCSNTQHHHNSPNPVDGQCRDYSAYWCANQGEGVATSQYWAPCN